MSCYILFYLRTHSTIVTMKFSCPYWLPKGVWETWKHWIKLFLNNMLVTFSDNVLTNMDMCPKMGHRISDYKSEKIINLLFSHSMVYCTFFQINISPTTYI